MPARESCSALPAVPPTPHIAPQEIKVEICADVDATKADSDKKSYRLVKLPNGLRALLVHDPPPAPTGDGAATAGPRSAKASPPKGGRGGGAASDGSDNSDDDSNGEEDDGDDDDIEESRDDTDEEGESEDGDEDEPEGVKKAAAAMAVGVGNFSDPEHCQGLAHYLEHMLFMGSTKYPDENEYDSFLSKSGGDTNAYTECEYTLFYFDVLPQHFEKALDIFAQFFVSPLMKADSSDRELQSIESEFCLSKNNDSCRLQELWCHTSKRDHPYSKFCWGNLWSLRDLPLSKGVDVRKELINFHARHYRAPAMQLVLLGGQSLDELQEMALQSFSGVAAAGKDDGKGGVYSHMEGGLSRESAAVAAAGLPFDSGALGRVFRVQPVKDVHRLTISWQMREQHSLYKKKPCMHLGHLIGDEGEGSVLSLLRHKGWATGISAGLSGGGYNESSCCGVFCVIFYLTKAGVRNWLDAADVLFRYIGMLKNEGPQEWVFQEIRDISNIQYRFQEESDASVCVQELAEQMLPTARYDDLHILKGPYLNEEWDPALIEDILGQLSPSSARYDVQSTIFGRAVDAPGDKPNNEKSGGEGENVATSIDDVDEAGKRGKKRAAEGKLGVKKYGGSEDGSESDSEKGSKYDSEDDSEDDSEGESGKGTGEEKEEEDLEEHYHELCKKPQTKPLQEPRFGLCFWTDPVPVEVLEEWKVSSSSHDVTVRSFSSHSRPTSSATTATPTTTPPPSIVAKRQAKEAVKEDGPVLMLALPKPNPFIPTVFDMKEVEPWPAVGAADSVKHDDGDGNKNNKNMVKEGVVGGTKAVAVLSSSRCEDAGKEDQGLEELLASKPSPRRVVRGEGSCPGKRTGGAINREGTVKVDIWHQQDRAFRQPRARLYLKIVTAVGNETPRSAALSELVVRLVDDSLVEYSYAAHVAELIYHLEAVDAGFQIHVSGFDHKAPLMLKEVLKRLLDLGEHLKEGPLSVQLEALVRGYHNANMKPGKHVRNARIQALRKGNWSAEQKLSALTGGVDGTPEGTALVSVEDVKAFLKRLFESIEMEGLVHGNFSEKDAEDILQDTQKVAEEASQSRKRGDGEGDGFSLQNKHDGNGNVSLGFIYPQEPIVKLNPSEHVIFCCPSKDPTEDNCALEVYWQIGVDSLDQRIITGAIEQVMHEPFYDQLRTKEQLGYSVSCSPRVTSGVLGFCCAAQSAAYGPAYLYSRIRAFMKSFRDTLADMTDEAFSKHMASAAANKLEPDNTLSEEAQRHWPEIFTRRRSFHMNVREAHFIRTLKKSAVLKAYEDWFSSNGTGKPCLTLAVTGGGKFSAEDEARALEAKIQKEHETAKVEGVSSPRKSVRILTAEAAYDPSEGRDVFPQLVAS